ncbi:DNA modification protein Mom [Striga asiatica]|uniref:DNA modification protein Mom n=1 Tax=Striga asiatica TaxID=4170 RepID=A0A5A7QYA9_STRAF|nr:DNA modification protein Mom [Striga asiatica]
MDAPPWRRRCTADENCGRASAVCYELNLLVHENTELTLDERYYYGNTMEADHRGATIRRNREVTPGRHQAKRVPIEKLRLPQRGNDLRCWKFLKKKARSQLVARLARSRYRGLEADLGFVARCKMAMIIDCSVPALMIFFCLGA